MPHLDKFKKNKQVRSELDIIDKKAIKPFHFLKDKNKKNNNDSYVDFHLDITKKIDELIEKNENEIVEFQSVSQKNPEFPLKETIEIRSDFNKIPERSSLFFENQPLELFENFDHRDDLFEISHTGDLSSELNTNDFEGFIDEIIDNKNIISNNKNEIFETWAIGGKDLHRFLAKVGKVKVRSKKIPNKKKNIKSNITRSVRKNGITKSKEALEKTKKEIQKQKKELKEKEKILKEKEKQKKEKLKALNAEKAKKEKEEILKQKEKEKQKKLKAKLKEKEEKEKLKAELLKEKIIQKEKIAKQKLKEKKKQIEERNKENELKEKLKQKEKEEKIKKQDLFKGEKEQSIKEKKLEEKQKKLEAQGEIKKEKTLRKTLGNIKLKKEKSSTKKGFTNLFKKKKDKTKTQTKTVKEEKKEESKPASNVKTPKVKETHIVQDNTVLDDEVSDAITIIDELLEQLPEEVIDEFVQSDNFAIYEKVVKKYKK